VSFPLLAFPKISTTRSDAPLHDEWVASEKIHGAQLVVGVDVTECRVGKRKAWLEADEPFFGWQMLRPLLLSAGRVIYQALGSVGRVWIYGELFGGQYPHTSVAPVAGLVPVQTGIWYAPDLNYAAFDIVHILDGQEPFFMGHDRVQELAAMAGVLTPPVLGRGRFSLLDQLPVRFRTRVPKTLGLPELEQNDAEGYVLKPVARSVISHRPCVKRKIPEFDEQRFDESSAFEPDAFLSLESLFALAARLINPPRLASARSKVGTDVSRMIEEAVLDALIDLRDMFPRRIDALTPDEERELVSHLEEQARSRLESEH